MKSWTEHNPGEPPRPHTHHVGPDHVVPLWTFFDQWFGAEPRADAEPYLWPYESLRPALIETAKVVSTTEAERRVLVLENPGLAGRHLVTDSLYAGLQLIMPGEAARMHRHTAAALRFVLEGEHTFTAVAGRRCQMRPGDFVVTPSWAWHEHRNESQTPTIWLDVLDVPLVRFLGAGFSEGDPEPRLPTTAVSGDTDERHDRTLRPVDDRSRAASPVFSYPYAQALEALEQLRRRSDPDLCHGIKMEYIDPTTGAPPIPTLSTSLRLLPKGFVTQAYATTASSVVTVVTGRGRVTIGDGATARELVYAPKDVWAIPSWQTVTVMADEESVLFSASDEAVHRKLGLWRERRGPG